MRMDTAVSMSCAAVLPKTNAVSAVFVRAHHVRSLLPETVPVRYSTLLEVHVRPLSMQASALLFAFAALRAIWRLPEVEDSTSPSGRPLPEGEFESRFTQGLNDWQAHGADGGKQSAEKAHDEGHQDTTQQNIRTKAKRKCDFAER